MLALKKRLFPQCPPILFPLCTHSLLWFVVFLTPNWGHASSQDPIGRLVNVSGTVEIQGASGKRTAVTGGKIYEKESIVTPAGAQAKVMLNDRSVIDIGPSSSFSFDEFKSGPTPASRHVSLGLAYGKIRSAINTPVSGEGRFKLRTKGIIMGVRGTEIVASDSYVSVPEGRVEVASSSNPSQTVVLNAGSMLQAPAPGVDLGSTGGLVAVNNPSAVQEMRSASVVSDGAFSSINMERASPASSGSTSSSSTASTDESDSGASSESPESSGSREVASSSSEGSSSGGDSTSDSSTQASSSEPAAGNSSDGAPSKQNSIAASIVADISQSVAVQVSSAPPAPPPPISEIAARTASTGPSTGAAAGAVQDPVAGNAALSQLTQTITNPRVAEEAVSVRVRFQR